MTTAMPQGQDIIQPALHYWTEQTCDDLIELAGGTVNDAQAIVPPLTTITTVAVNDLQTFGPSDQGCVQLEQMGENTLKTEEWTTTQPAATIGGSLTALMTDER